MSENGRVRPNRPDREPMLNAPWPPAVLALLLLALYAVQDRWRAGAYVLVPVEVADGRWVGLLSSIFLHGGWAHAGLNAAFLLAFGAAVSRRFGLGAVGALAFLLFFLVCGVLAGLGYVAVHPDGLAPVVGASGAVAGLMGAASRLLGDGGRLDPLSAGRVVGMAVAWVIVNLFFAVFGAFPLGGGAVAWEAHLVGYGAGLLLIGPAVWLANRVPR